MDTNYQKTYATIENNKKAHRKMGLVGFLLLIIIALTMSASYGISFALSYFSLDIQDFLANALSYLSGISKVHSIALAKSILSSGAFSDIILMLKTI